MRSWEQGGITVVTSPEMIDEARRVLSYPKIKNKYGLKEHDIKKVVLNLIRYSLIVEEPPPLDEIKLDPADKVVLSTAIEGKADYVVSGDHHLLNLGHIQGIKIITPRKLCEVMGL